MSTTIFAPLPANFDGNTYHTSLLPANRVKSVTDRRLDTFSTETLFVLDLTDNPSVTHLFVKGTDIASIAAVDAGNTNLFNTVDTSMWEVTNAQGEVVAHDQDGFDNYLIPVNSPPFSANQITVTLTGTNRKLYEIAALEVQVELDAKERFSQFDFTPVWRGWTTHRMGNGRLKGVPPVNQEPPRDDVSLQILYLDNATWITRHINP